MEHDLPREAVPTEWLNDAKVWTALLQRMPMTALVRNLGKLSAVGVVTPLGDALPLVLSALRDADRIRKARLHPLAILLALKTYAQGRGEKGKLTWEPVPQVIDALNAAFYTAFANVVPTGKRVLLALDVSGSMAGGGIAGTSLTPREGSAAMALMTAATEENYHIVGFTTSGGNWQTNTQLTPLPLTPSMRLDDAVKAVSNLPFGGTDCALPMLHALEKGLKGGRLRGLHGSWRPGREDRPGAGAAGVPDEDRHRGETRRGGHGVERGSPSPTRMTAGCWMWLVSTPPHLR